MLSVNAGRGFFRNNIFSILTLSLALVFLNSCSSDEKRSDTPEGAFSLAQEYEKDERFEEAIRRYNEIKNKFPYSKYATMAELAAADTYFKQESFAEAQVAYQGFKELHPKHPQIDYVTFRLGLSYYEQLPSTIDRDLALASSAILYFDEVISQYPNSAHAKDAQEKRKESLMKLAQKEEYIADFYFKKGVYDSALTRYEGLFRTYGDLGFEAKAIGRAALCAHRSGDQDRAKRYLSMLKQRYPDSDDYKTAAGEIK